MCNQSTQEASSSAANYEVEQVHDEVLTADQAIIDQAWLSSEADLYYAKLQLEDRLKYALGYNFTFETPLTFVQNFFECAFSVEQRSQTGPIK